MLLLLDIGHQKERPGAVNQTAGIHEFPFNDNLATDIIAAYNGEHTVQKFYRRSYETIPGDVNALNPGFVISLHCNAFDTRASYTTVLYAHGRARSAKLASILHGHLVAALGLRDAGIKALTEEDRGGSQVHGIACPNVIAEPFFIDNDSDLAVAEARRAELVQAYVDTIKEAFAGHV